MEAYIETFSNFFAVVWPLSVVPITSSFDKLRFFTMWTIVSTVCCNRKTPFSSFHWNTGTTSRTIFLDCWRGNHHPERLVWQKGNEHDCSRSYNQSRRPWFSAWLYRVLLKHYTPAGNCSVKASVLCPVSFESKMALSEFQTFSKPFWKCCWYYNFTSACNFKKTVLCASLEADFDHLDLYYQWEMWGKLMFQFCASSD